ncbi:MAG: nucleotidyltransferase domain-containing protein [Deltaproteobacteria bacterium]|jgi:predicted nucleotidyltransferase|nr:nucleotidyltransferase domain-containing protein [Deltaproteobacteria bacterium]
MDINEKTIIDKIVLMIVSAFSPEKIILFGSRARGDHSPDSDYDILVIMKDLDDRIELATRLYREISTTDLPKKIDFLTISSARYEELKTSVGLIYRTINIEGKVIYEKHL